MRAFDAALGTPWAMEPQALDHLLTIAARQHEVTPEALEAYRAQAVERAEAMERRGNVAILNMVGPMFRRANLFTEFSGAFSYDIARRDLQVAIDDKDVRSILLNIDSPGGDANGAGELAKAIHAAPKPVVAYVGGTGASAAYWLASAARQVWVDDSAALGSIGVIIGVTDRSSGDAERGIRRWSFVSSQSPRKAGDPATEDGAAQYQDLADQMAEVFVSAVAQHRGVDAETVTGDFGAGGVLIGARAVAAGMADKVDTFESLLSALQEGREFQRAPASRNRRRQAQDKPKASAGAPTSHEEVTMADPTQADAQAAEPKVDVEAERRAAAADAVRADRARRGAIMSLPEAQGREALADHLHAQTDLSVDQVQAALAVAPSSAPVAAAAEPAAEAAAYEERRVAGAGLGGSPVAAVSGKSGGLVDRMKAMIEKEG